MKSFSIAFLPAEEQLDPQPGTREGVIRIGGFEERFQASTEYWTQKHYESQWLAAVDRLRSHAQKSCLITSINDPVTANFLFWWPMYLIGDRVYFQNHVLFLSDIKGTFDPCNPYPHIPDRNTTSENGDRVSEWTIPLSDVADARDALLPASSPAPTSEPAARSADAYHLLSEHLPQIRRKFAVHSLAIFGSVARNEASAGSDLDVLVEFAGRPTFDNYMGLKLYLEALFGVAVDLAIPSDLRPALRPRIEQEALRVS